MPVAVHKGAAGPRDNGGKSVAQELNRAAILENFLDDKELLFESIDLFLERISVRMAGLKKALADKNPEAFMPEAHTVKGMLGIFSTAGAFETAKKLEIKGREKVTHGVDDDFQVLENEVELLVSALRAWRSDQG
jgi:HPt (histidine-containing phosphotransfer) domain-containing protein